MKVYIVEYGEYSDHTYHSIHSTRERAQKVVDRLKTETWESRYESLGICERYPNAQVTEWEVDSYELPVVPPGQQAFRVTITPDGDVNCDDYTDGARLFAEEHAREDYTFLDRNRQPFITFVFARDSAHAAKIAQDRRARALAEREGVA